MHVHTHMHMHTHMQPSGSNDEGSRVRGEAAHGFECTTTPTPPSGCLRHGHGAVPREEETVVRRKGLGERLAGEVDGYIKSPLPKPGTVELRIIVQNYLLRETRATFPLVLTIYNQNPPPLEFHTGRFGHHSCSQIRPLVSDQGKVKVQSQSISRRP